MSTWPEAETFSARWHMAVKQNASRTFLIFESSSGKSMEWTYYEFDDLVARAAEFLWTSGVRRELAVHLALTNSPAFIALWIATVRLGAWIVPSDPFGSSAEFAEHIARTHPVIGFCASTRRDAYLGAAPSMPVFNVNEDDWKLELFGKTRFTEWPHVGLRDRAAVMFTSGTTGRPKGVVVSQANYAFAGKTMSKASNLGSQHRQIVVLPMFHANAQYYSFASAIWAGASVALMHTFSASKFLTQVAQHKATHASLFAAPIRMILAKGPERVLDMSLEHCWYAMNISLEQHETLSGLLGCAPRQLYGMTETIPAVLTDLSPNPNPASMGFVTNGCEVEVQDPDHKTVPAGIVGEVVVRGEVGITLFDGYLDDPQTTTDSFVNGWFLTGDRASLDEGGLFYFDGRRQDVLKVAGENVSTIEVELVLSSHPKVLEAVVVGLPDALRDEVPIAFAVAANIMDPPTVIELIAWCEQRLAKAKRPRQIVLIDELPRTSVGKIRKYLIKEMALDSFQSGQHNVSK